MKLFKFNKLSNELKQQAASLSARGFKQIFDHIDQDHIKKAVDTVGLDKFIDQCAYLAAGSGVISGSGGLATLLVGTPLDTANLIAQQFRVTIAIMYDSQGSYNFGFAEFMGMVATSLRVDAGLQITKTVMESIAEKMMLLVGTRTAERLVPIIGGVIAGAANYLFIKRIAEKVKEAQTLQILAI